MPTGVWSAGGSASRQPLIGRARELEMVRDLWRLPQTRVLTLTGLGGTGKTTIALQFAAEVAPAYPQRAWVVELAAITDADLVPIVVATQLGLRGVSATAQVDVLATFLSSQPSLLVLDNCEHLIDACAGLADSLLGACQELRIIATSREPLHIPGEQQFRVPSLDTADPDADDMAEAVIASVPAVQLFVARAQAVLPSFRLTSENAANVASICSRLGGIPLAIELAAARVHVLGTDQILARLDDAFRFLTVGSRVAPTRHQTLQATLDWSDALLSETERIVFRRLGVFVGAFQLDKAEEVCSSAEIPVSAVLDAVMGLADKSLIVAQSDDGVAWYHLLEPVRQYALWHLRDQRERDRTFARHAAAYVSLAERAAPAIRGPEQERWLDRLSREQGNLRAALEWATDHADSRTALRLSSALVPFWEAHGHLIEGLHWLHQTLAMNADGVDPVLRMQALRGAGRLTFQYAGGDAARYATAEALNRESLALAESIGDRNGIAWALTELGMVYRLQRDLSRSAEVLTQALDIFRVLDDVPGIAMAKLNLGSTIGYGLDTARSYALLSESLDLYRALGDQRFAAIACVLLSRSAMLQGDIDGALQLGAEAIEQHAHLGDRWFVAFDLMAMSDALLARSRPRDAVRLFAAAQALSVRLNSAGEVGTVTFRELVESIDSLRTATWFDRVWEEGQALDLTQVVEAVQSTLRERTSARLDSASSTPTSMRLTRRELEVARLLAEGHTDRQIADALYVSTRTVGVHVHNILRKLELRSRVEVAGWLAHHEPCQAD